MILHDVALLCAVSVRTYAYLEVMVNENMYPSICYILANGKAECNVERVNNEEENEYFHINENLVDMFERAGIKYTFLGTKDANNDTVFDVIKEMEEKYIIYSGYGGCILSKRLFDLDKKFIHIHAGLLPEYRGSTTAYYSILSENIIGATGIIMNEKIDEGDIIFARSFPVPNANISIDYIYEPWVRSQVLCEILRNYIKDGRIKNEKQEGKSQETYFIIHPVLKHLALLYVEKNRK